MVSQDKDRQVIGWVVAPPALPVRVPRTVAAAKHLAAHDVGAHVLENLAGHLRVDRVFAAAQALLLAPTGGREYPLVQPQPALPDWVLEALVGAGDESVERDRDLAGDFTHTYIYIRTAARGAGYDRSIATTKAPSRRDRALAALSASDRKLARLMDATE